MYISPFGTKPCHPTHGLYIWYYSAVQVEWGEGNVEASLTLVIIYWHEKKGNIRD